VLINIKENYNDRLLKQWIEVYQKENHIGEYATSIKRLIDSLIDVNAYTEQRFQLYIEYFEIPFIETMKLFHEKRAANDNIMGDMMEFMSKVNTHLKNAEAIVKSTYLFNKKATYAIEEESIKAQHYAHATSYPNIMKTVEAEYIVHYSHAIIEAFKEMLEANNEKGCKLAYGLLSRTTDGPGFLATLYHQHILQLGRQILKELSQQQQAQLKVYLYICRFVATLSDIIYEECIVLLCRESIMSL
jgi:hypothetical protein